MSKTIEAVYENGVFRPLEAVTLPEGEHVHFLIVEDCLAMACVKKQDLLFPLMEIDRRHRAGIEFRSPDEIRETISPKSSRIPRIPS